MILLTKNALDGFKAASFKASEKILQESNEGQYIFLKRMCQILVQLGISQLGPLWVCMSTTKNILGRYVCHLQRML